MKEAIRVGRIEIDTVKIHGPKWIAAVIQTLELNDDNEVLAERVRDKRLYRRADHVAMETVSVKDPVTQQTLTASVAGMAALIKTVMVKWMVEDNAAYYDPATDLVVLDDTSS